ncbi:COG4223 family protein [Paracoccus sp. T5]|uniref:COG4223 family protein n=1 Tax=Paracoccus sp. T5 TaxID=3402161 RepID=UPI003AEA2B87
MKQPSKTQAGDKAAKTTGSDGSTPAAKKASAAPGVIASTETGTGKPAQAGQPGQVTPAESTLVGDADKGLPPAQPKAGPAAPDQTRAKETAASAEQTPAKDAAATGPFAHQDRPKDTAASASAADQTRGAYGSSATDAARPGSTPAGASSSTTSPSKSAAPVRKTGFWPVALGGVVAAGLGAAATIYALPHLPPEWHPATQAPAAAAPAADDGALQQAAEEAARRVVAEELAARPAAADDAASAEMAERLTALEERLAAAGETPTDDGAAEERAAAAEQLTALQQRLDEQQARLEELAARPAFDQQAATEAQSQIEAAAADAEQRLEAARAEAQELQDAAAESTRRAEAVAAIASLQSALDRGVTPEEARQTLEGAGLQTPEELTTEVPSLTSLQADFPEASRAALRGALRDSSASGQGNLVTNFLRAQTGARSVEVRQGDDPDAILSRANAQVEAGHIDQAVTEIEALPESARSAPAMADWLSRATAYTQAQAALSDLSSGTN